MGDRYWEWVNLPINRPIRFFQSEILELLTITPWYILPIVWLPIITYLLYSGCVLNSTNIGNLYSIHTKEIVNMYEKNLYKCILCILYSKYVFFFNDYSAILYYTMFRSWSIYLDHYRIFHSSKNISL